MKAVFDARTATPHFPGIGRYAQSLGRALAALLPELRLLLPDGAEEASGPPDRARCPSAQSPFSLRQQWTVPRLLRQIGAELYHSPYYLMPYRPGVPTVLTCHDLIPVVVPGAVRPIPRLIFRLSQTLAARVAGRILAVSEHTKTDLARRLRVPPAKIAVTLLAAAAGMTPQTPESIAGTRRRLGLPETYLLYVGSNKPHKNLAVLVQALAMVPAESGQPPPHLVIAGGMDHRFSEPAATVARLRLGDRVHLAGFRGDEELAALYSGAMAFVFPSLYEGFGLPILEAMACGAPVICGRVASLPEVAGNAALYTDPRDPAGLAAAIAGLRANPGLQARLRQAGLRQAGRFSWSRTAATTVQAYRQILDEQRAGHP